MSDTTAQPFVSRQTGHFVRLSAMDIKICGLKTAETVAAALNGGATHIGFIFFPKSPRNIDPREAGRLRLAAHGRARAVAVTVDADDAMLDTIVAQMQPDMLQLHGRESPERIATIKQRYKLPVIKAIPIGDREDIEKITAFKDIADRLLLDARPPADAQLPGGNGIAFDWRLLAQLDTDVDYLLSGGLTAANIGEALLQAHPHGIDISSGVEREPGVKDVALIDEFFRALRAAQRKIRD